jgi:hypothetical protein
MYEYQMAMQDKRTEKELSSRETWDIYMVEYVAENKEKLRRIVKEVERNRMSGASKRQIDISAGSKMCKDNVARLTDC